MPIPEIELTADGSQTLRHPIFGETYHSLRGAAGESAHVFIEAGFREALLRKPKGPIQVLEAGFGTGLNCLLTARAAEEAGIQVEYTGVELYPVPEEVWRGMEYAVDPVFEALHHAPWGERTTVTPWLSLEKTQADLAGMAFDATFDVIYMDAFAPDVQPELWTHEVFARLYAATAPGGMLVTYSAKGTVKQALRAAGYRVERLPGALGKRHMLRAIK